MSESKKRNAINESSCFRIRKKLVHARLFNKYAQVQVEI